MRLLITLVALVSFFQTCYADKAVVEDFTDCGTWRQRDRKGNTPGSWFASDHSFGGAPCKARPDGYAGVVRFDMSAKHSVTGFERFKATAAASVFADAVEFSADNCGHDAKVLFILHDSLKKKYYTKAVSLRGSGWHDYILDLNDKTVKNYTRMEQPVRLFRVIFILNNAKKGSLMIDDIALCGDVSRKNVLTVKPVYNGIIHKPGDDIVMKYMVRNGKTKAVSGKLSLKVYDFNDKPVYKDEKSVNVKANGVAFAEFAIGKLPIGSYHTKVEIAVKRINNEFNGWLAVANPNGKRVNSIPMFFGVQDTTNWNTPSENKLHLTWLKALGADIVRYGTTGGRLTGLNNPACLEATRRQVMPLLDAGILMCLSYLESPPAWVQKEPYFHRRMPDKMPELAEHMRMIGKFTANHPGINYFEWWNEPDISFLHDTKDNYLKCLKVVYANLKKENPRLNVTTGGVTIKHPKEKKNFSRDMYWEGKGYYDIACFHAHGAMSNYVERNNMVEKWLKEKNIDVPLCNTETGERSGYKVPSIKKQAATLVKKLTFARSRHTEFYIWFTLQDYWDMDAAADDSFGLITSDNQPKPSFIAYTNLIKQLANTVPAAPVELDPALQTFHFRDKAGGDVFVSWPDIDGNSIMFSLKSDKPVVVSDIFGTEKTLSPLNGIVDIQSMKYPFYLKIPKGAMQGRVSLVKLAGQIFAAAGKDAAIDININNPWREKITVKISDSDGRQSLTADLNPGKQISRQITKKIPADAPMGPVIVKLDVDVKGKGISRQIKLPVSINVAYEVGKSISKAPVFKVDSLGCVREMTYDPAIPRWRNTEDLSASLQMCVDKKYLNVVFNVKDDIHSNKHTGINIWNGDSVQFAVMSRDGKHTEVTFALTGKGSEVWCHISPAGKYLGSWTVPAKISRKEKLTVYNISLPLDRLGIKPEAGTPFRFSFLVNEDDGMGRVRWIEHFGGIGFSKNPTEFGWAMIK